MKKFALLLVALCLVVGMSGTALALDHTMVVLDSSGTKCVGYTVSIWVETGTGYMDRVHRFH